MRGGCVVQGNDLLSRRIVCTAEAVVHPGLGASAARHTRALPRL
jgi:hypothetical protein